MEHYDERETAGGQECAGCGITAIGAAARVFCADCATEHTFCAGCGADAMELLAAA